MFVRYFEAVKNSCNVVAGILLLVNEELLRGESRPLYGAPSYLCNSAISDLLTAQTLSCLTRWFLVFAGPVLCDRC